MKLHPTARLLIIAGFLFAIQSTVGVLSHIHADEPANSPVIPLAVSEGDPDTDSLEPPERLDDLKYARNELPW